MIGLWHEISVRYLLWGLYHAAGVLVWQSWQRQKRRLKLPKATTPATKAMAGGLATLVTVHFVWLGFALVREPDLRSALQLLSDLLLPWS